MEVQEEELNDMLFTHTVSEQATVTLHSDDFLETFLVSQPIVLNAQFSNEVNIQEEEFQDMLFTQTVSEQATFRVHEEDFSVPLLLQELIYDQINFDDVSRGVQSF